jgi:primary-amine oxidase
MHTPSVRSGRETETATQYFDGLLVNTEGDVKVARNVICLHEQDNGIGWKHTNWRTGRAVVTRRRELVVQYIITLANYEYVFNVSWSAPGEDR